MISAITNLSELCLVCLNREPAPLSVRLPYCSTLHHPQLLPLDDRQHDRITWTNARVQPVRRHEAILREEPGQLFLVDRTLGVYVNHHWCEKPIPGHSSRSASRDSPHVPWMTFSSEYANAFCRCLVKPRPVQKRPRSSWTAYGVPWNSRGSRRWRRSGLRRV
jgi:hypothetical protein